MKTKDQEAKNSINASSESPRPAHADTPNERLKAIIDALIARLIENTKAEVWQQAIEIASGSSTRNELVSALEAASIKDIQHTGEQKG